MAKKRRTFCARPQVPGRAGNVGWREVGDTAVSGARDQRDVAQPAPATSLEQGARVRETRWKYGRVGANERPFDDGVGGRK